MPVYPGALRFADITDVGFGPLTFMILELSELDHVGRFRRRGSDPRSSDSLGEDNRASSELGITQATDSTGVSLLPLQSVSDAGLSFQLICRHRGTQSAGSRNLPALPAAC